VNPSIMIRKTIRSVANSFGFDVVREKNRPNLTLLGIRGWPIRTIIDVGANTGQFAKKISAFFPNAKLYCFEPLPGPFEILKEWATQRSKIVCFNLALGDKEVDLEMFLHEDHTPSSSLLPTTILAEQLYPFTKKQKSVRVRQNTLDAILGSNDSEMVPEILIKLDVQGYENRVIAGGEKIFSAASACILEVNLENLYDGQTGFKDLLMMLETLGYRYGGNLNQAYAEDGRCIFLDAVFLNRRG